MTDDELGVLAGQELDRLFHVLVGIPPRGTVQAIDTRLPIILEAKGRAETLRTYLEVLRLRALAREVPVRKIEP